MLCFFAGRAVPLDDDELNGAVRRAELLLAAGGDPHRPLDPFGRAATALADDLDTPERRGALVRHSRRCVPRSRGSAAPASRCALLLSDPDLAWRSYATSLLAEALAEE